MSIRPSVGPSIRPSVTHDLLFLLLDEVLDGAGAIDDAVEPAELTVKCVDDVDVT